ncbi:hypothetical protein ACJ51O_23225 [Burkholderia pyrrocinia]|uniref:hypothetical protein n=1 Tax=Burkholderia pyrrocinia TaxID=60550 RepID=UPI0038B5819F
MQRILYFAEASYDQLRTHLTKSSPGVPHRGDVGIPAGFDRIDQITDFDQAKLFNGLP